MAPLLTAIWQPIGPAPIQDPIQGRLAVAPVWGQSYASGAVNGLAIRQLGTADAPGDAALYIGTVNGGVWMRPYSYANDSWGEWRWLSLPSNNPSTGYQGIQSIGQLALSPDGRYLAVGQGNPSNYGGASSGISRGIQLAKIEVDGSLSWLPESRELVSALAGQNIRGLTWAGDDLYITSRANPPSSDFQLSVAKIEAGVPMGAITRLLDQDKFIQTTLAPGGDVYGISLDAGLFRFDPAAPTELRPVTGARVHEVLMSLGSPLVNLRIGAYPERIDGKTIVFVGSALQRGKVQTIARLARLELDGNQLVSAATFEVPIGLIGTNQAGINYGNFSFAADPTDPEGRTLLAGGNHYGGESAGGPFTGGLVAVHFGADGSVTSRDQFGPRNGVIDVSRAGGTAPHADGRAVVFYRATEGLRLIQSDDGGVWQKGLADRDPWLSLSDVGLQTTEIMQGDWSHKGNAVIAGFQDNSAAMGVFGDPIWSNIWAGDGNLALFDDATFDGYDGNLFSRGYFQAQQYMETGYLFSTTLDDSSRWLETNIHALTTLDEAGNPVLLADYDAGWLRAVSPSTGYPFGLPAETNPGRAGDLVLAGVRNLYEAILPHWTSADMQIVTVPLLSPEAELRIQQAVEFDSDNSGFRALEVGSGALNVQAFARPKPYSWDALYASYFDAQTRQSYLLGRPASVSDQPLDPASYQLQQIAIVEDAVVTDVAFNPGSSAASGSVPTLYVLASASSLRYFSNAKGGRIGVVRGGPGQQTVQYFSYQELGLKDDANLQSLAFLPATAAAPAQLIVGGLGGAWISDVQSDGLLDQFRPMTWQGLPPQTGPGSWIVQLKYDQVDDVVMANFLGQGSWIYSRSGQLEPAPAKPLGFSITSAFWPQSLDYVADRKGRPVDGLVSVQLQRSDEQLNQTIEAELLLHDPALWRASVGLYADVSHQNNLVASSVVRNGQISIPLSFAPGVNTLTLEASPLRPDLVLPEIQLNLSMSSEAFPGADADASMTLYPAGMQPSFYQQNTPGVFYNYRAMAGNAVSTFTSMLPAALPQGSRVGYYLCNADGSITVDPNLNTVVRPGDAGYDAVIAKMFVAVGTANAPYNPLALTPSRALNAFDNGVQFRQSEGQFYGNVQLSSESVLLTGQNFAMALMLPDASIYSSVGDQALGWLPSADNTLVFDPQHNRYEVGLAPAAGEVFAAQSSTYTLSVARLGADASGYGLYRVDDLMGSVDGLAPTAPGYAVKALERALSQSVDGITGASQPAYGEVASQSLEGLALNCYYATFITPNTTVAAALALLQDMPPASPTNTLFASSITAANQGIVSALPLGSSLYTFEDRGLMGDRDMNDVVLKLTPELPY